MPNKIYSFEILSNTELSLFENQFKPNYFVNIKKTFNLKLKAIKQYKKELKDYPSGRSLKGIEVLSNYRGLSAGFEHAEAFMLLKEIS